MNGYIDREERDGVVVLRLNRPLANALAPELRAELITALADTSASGAALAIVIAGAGEGFSSGVDLSEYDAPPVAPSPSELCRAVAACPLPVIAALHGNALGAGLSLALAADARVAHEAARLALPEISLGMMPGAGATQRLPRLVGAQAALELMLSGRSVRATDARLRPMFESIVTADAEGAAVTLARRIAQGMAHPSAPRGLSDPAGYHKAITTVRQHLRTVDAAAADILRAIEAAQLLPLPQGLAFEEVLFEERAQSRSARAMRHVHVAEARARALPEARLANPRMIRRIALTGPVPSALGDRLGAAGCELRRVPDEGPGDGWADLWIEVGAPAPARAARLRLDTGTGFAANGLWLRYSDRTPFAELGVAPGVPAADVAGLARLLTLAQIGFVRATLPAAGPGIGHVLQGALDLAALALLRAGVGVAEVDAGATALGFARGPCLLMDHEGLAAVQARLAALAPRLGLPAPGTDGPLAERLARGAVGRASGRGFYDHPPEGPRAPRSDRTAPLPGGVSPEHALHAALVNAAERLITSGAVLRPGDLDVLAVHALGQSREAGGPLCQADARGLMALLKDMKALAPLSAPLWSPHPALLTRIKEGLGYFGRRAADISPA
ncbi:enoyl-CoA hydratase-related protein [Roseovarius sp. MBR-6]|uniref:enoyl-CoA hydratase-related protein n=1 Tax=Roseovarius sp. MBR-6 TaxID=3156459 RepID=UPI003393B22E